MNKTTPLSVVIADDCKDNATSLAELVTLWGHDANVCLQPELAVEYCLKFWPDVLLLDIGFPLRTDGLRVAREVRKLPRARNALIVAITGFGDEEVEIQAKEAGFDYYMLKPVDLSKLEYLITEVGHMKSGRQGLRERMKSRLGNDCPIDTGTS